MAGILLTHNYFLRRDTGEWLAMRPWMPIGPLVQAAVLRDAGLPFRFFDTTFETSTAGYRLAVRESSPELVMICADPFNVPQKMCLSSMREAAFEMAKVAREAGAIVVASGPGPTSYPEIWLAEGGVDAVMTGEVEQTQLDLWEAVRDGQPLAVVPGLLLPGTEQLTATDKRPRLKKLEQLPSPARELADVDRYMEAWRNHHGRSTLSLVTSRGCPYACNWCAKPVYGRRFTARSPEAVVEEWRELKARYKPDYIWIADEIFGLDRRFLKAFSDGIQEAKAQIPFECLSRADLIDDESAALLSAAGCDAVWLGAESGSQSILDAMDKGTKVEEIVRARSTLRKAGIRTGFFLQVGYPGETWNELVQTRELVRKCVPDWIGISVTYPLPGTPFWEAKSAELGDAPNWRVSMECELLFQSAYPAAFYKRYRKMLHRDFALRRESEALRESWKDAPLGALSRIPRMARLAAGGAGLDLLLRAEAKRQGP